MTGIPLLVLTNFWPLRLVLDLLLLIWVHKTAHISDCQHRYVHLRWCILNDFNALDWTTCICVVKAIINYFNFYFCTGILVHYENLYTDNLLNLQFIKMTIMSQKVGPNCIWHLIDVGKWKSLEKFCDIVSDTIWSCNFVTTKALVTTYLRPQNYSYHLHWELFLDYMIMRIH